MRQSCTSNRAARSSQTWENLSRTCSGVCEPAPDARASRGWSSGSAGLSAGRWYRQPLSPVHDCAWAGWKTPSAATRQQNATRTVLILACSGARPQEQDMRNSSKLEECGG